MKTRQLSLFARNQSICAECRQPFVGYSKEAVALWATEFDWFDAPAAHWASDRVYQQNIRFCSAECARDNYAREQQKEIERIRHKNYGRFR